MVLKASQQQLLQNELHNIGKLLSPDMYGLVSEEQVLDYCRINDIPLYDVTSMTLSTGQNLLQRLFLIISQKSAELLDSWRADFVAAQHQAGQQLRQMHSEAWLDVGDQFQRSGRYSRESLLTLRDMNTLLMDDRFQAADALLAAPMPLTEATQSQMDALDRLLQQARGTQTTVFIPLVHDGHWFYLLKSQEQWFVIDSQPMAANELSMRQRNILLASDQFLQERGETPSATFYTSNAQHNDYECGSHVVNAWRRLANPAYVSQSHAELLAEALAKQVPQAMPAYQHELMAARHRLFTNINRPIDIDLIDSAEADVELGESDEEFATRLQEAEFRKAGLL